MRCRINIKNIIVLAVLLAGILFLSATGERELVSVILGNGSSFTGNTAGCPINLYYKSLHGQFIYTAAELNTAGIFGPALLTQVGFFVNTAPSYALPGFIIRMKHTAASNVASWQSAENMATVYSASFYQPTPGGYEMLNLSESFLWNGNDNLVIDTAFGIAADWSATGTVQYTFIEDGYRFTRNDLYDQTNSFAGGMSTGFRPNVRLTFVQGDNVPEISTDIDLLAAELFTNEESADSLTIFNLGSQFLVYTITETPEVEWFSYHPLAGTIESGGSEVVTGSFSAYGLAPGSYQTSLLLDSNDLQTPQLTVTVEMLVLNTPPSIDLPDSFEFDTDLGLLIDFSFYIQNPDGGPLTLSCSGNTNVLIQINDLMVFITAIEGWIGSELVTFTISDGMNQASASVLVIVNPYSLAIPDVQIYQIGPETLRIEWNAVASEVYYQIWGCDNPFGTYALLGVTDNLHWDQAMGDLPMQFFRVIASDVPISY